MGGSGGGERRMLENETRRLIGWLPGEPGGHVAGPGAPPVGPWEREKEKDGGQHLSWPVKVQM